MAKSFKNEEETLSKKLTAGLKKNALATINLTSIMGQAFKAQGDVAKTFIAAGNKNAIAANNLSTTFSTVGLSLNETLSNFKDMQKVGLDMTSKGNRDLFARYTLLGADTRGLSKIMALNEQTLGFSNESSRALGDSLLETAAANGFSSDVLVQAMNSLAQTFIRSSAVYGKGTTDALRKATENLIGKYGAGNAELVKEMTSKLFAGTAESTKMVSKLGLDMSKLASTDSSQVQSLIEQAIEAVRNKIGGAAGEGSSGFTVSRLLEVFGATPGMLALANLGPQMGQATKDTAETLANQNRQANLMSTLNTLMKDLVIVLMPAVTAVSTLLSPLAASIGGMNGLLGKIVLGITALKIIMMMPPWARILAGILSVIGIGLDMAEESSKTNEDILAEQEKQTAALVGESSTAKILGNISLGILQSNILNEQILINAQEHLEKTTEMAENPATTSTADGSYEM